jgi:transposase
VEQLDQLLSVRKSLSAALAGFELQARQLPHAAPRLEPLLVALQAQQDAGDKQLAAQTVAHAEFARVAELEKVPGIGQVSAATLAARLSAHPFRHSAAFVAYCSLDVGCASPARGAGRRA